MNAAATGVQQARARAPGLGTSPMPPEDLCVPPPPPLPPAPLPPEPAQLQLQLQREPTDAARRVEQGISIRARPTEMSVPETLRELIERRAAQMGIEFTPLAAHHPSNTGFATGKQLYRLGQVVLFLERNVVFARTSPPPTSAPTSAPAGTRESQSMESAWLPYSLENLFILATRH